MNHLAILRRLFLLKRDDAPKNDHEAGMTIIEILIVIALIGTIMTIVVSNFMGSADKAKIELASVGASNIGSALQIYKLDNGKIPGSEDGLKALTEKPASAKNWRGPYIEDDKLLDPWKIEYAYENVDGKTYKIVSAGPDATAGNEDDVIYPKAKGGEKSEP